MDSEIVRNGRLVAMIDKEWRDDIINLPHEDIEIPIEYLPDPEPDNNGHPLETLKEQEQKWTDLGLSRINNE